jgi:hypothetical protein
MQARLQTSRRDANHPNRVQSVNVFYQKGLDFWPWANSNTDPWSAGGAAPRYFRWEISFNVDQQLHGSNLTRDDFQYNGLDVSVGDWIGGAVSGQCLKIISISFKTKRLVTCVVEDWLRYNTFQKTTGNGMFSNGPAIVFQINEKGKPVLDPLPSATISNDFYPNVLSKFSVLNPQDNVLLSQIGHEFNLRDSISVTTNGFVVSSAATADKTIGVVLEIGPGPDEFIILPKNKIIDYLPEMPGSQGDVINVNEQGELTTATGVPAYLVIDSPVASTITGTANNPTISSGYSVFINGVEILFNNSPTLDVFEITQAINATPGHKCIATAIPTPTQATTNPANAHYGLVGGFVPFSAWIENDQGNVLVEFTTTTNGQSEFNQMVSTAQDLATDINTANIPGIVAIVQDGNLIISSTTGSLIQITNNTLDTNMIGFAGDNSISGIALFTAPSGSHRLRLSRSDGGEILLYEDSDVFQNNVGIFSCHNGRPARVIPVDKGIGGVAEDLVIRTTIVADGTNSEISIGQIPASPIRNFYLSRIVLAVTTEFSGGSVDYVVITDGENQLVGEADSDVTATGVYVVDSASTVALVEGSSIQAQFKQANGQPAVPTAGSMVVTVYYSSSE